MRTTVIALAGSYWMSVRNISYVEKTCSHRWLVTQAGTEWPGVELVK